MTTSSGGATSGDKLQALINYSLYVHSAKVATDGKCEIYQPFKGQVQIAKAVFTPGCRIVFVRCGRGWGKSLTAIFIACKYALENPGTYVMIMAPLSIQVKKIYLYSGLLQAFLMPELVEKFRFDDGFVFLKNGSVIDLDGSNNVEAQRGVKPHLVVADEYKDFDSGWLSMMQPNLNKVLGTLLVLGTPPEYPILEDNSDHHYVALDKEVRLQAASNPGTAFHIVQETADNPFADREAIEQARQRAISRGCIADFEREYLAKIVRGSESLIFPHLDEEKHVVPHAELVAKIGTDPERYDFVVSCDPGTKAVFAVTFMAIDRYEATPYWLDEIYEVRAAETTAGLMCPRIKEKMAEWNIPESAWWKVADSAAASFIVDAGVHHDLHFSPSVKQPGDRTEWIGILKDVFHDREKVFSDRCVKTFAEFINYKTNARGLPVKEKDHAIDAGRYGLKYISYTFKPRIVVPKIVKPTSRLGRFQSIEDDVGNMLEEGGWIHRY